ncbi:MAG TPA: glycosyltransferase [Chitinispirillaceae bacterium]|nr:glycosyltransferase [Chitinispirillaceae bacterium]
MKLSKKHVAERKFDTMSLSPTLSICMIVKNEAAILGRCLKSIVAAADEIVVVDTGSTDDTIVIARSFGAKVIEEPWRNDFSFARNISLQYATSSWILWLDADDVVPESSCEKIRVLKSGVPDKVYGFTIRNQRPGNTGTEFVQARMFPNNPAIRFERKIHEQMMPDALRIGLKMQKIDIVIEHHGYAAPEVLKLKASRNLQLLLDEYKAHGPDAVTALEIGDSYQLTGLDDEAYRWYYTTIEIPGCVSSAPALAGQAYLGLGTIANRKGMHQDAIQYLDKAFQCSPWRPDIHYGLAVAHEMEGNRSTAIEYLRKLQQLKEEPGQVGVDFRGSKLKGYLRLIRLFAESDMLKEAFAVTGEALEVFPQRAELHLLYGKLLLKTKKLIDSLHTFEKSISLNREENLDSFIGLCIIYRVAGAGARVGETLQAIEPLFGNRDKYKAFRVFFAEYPCSEEVREHLAEEYQNIRKEFFQAF